MKCENCGHYNQEERTYIVNGIEYGCTCPPHLREETEKPGDEAFLPQTGCLACGKWDNPPRLIGAEHDNQRT